MVDHFTQTDLEVIDLVLLAHLSLLTQEAALQTYAHNFRKIAKTFAQNSVAQRE